MLTDVPGGRWTLYASGTGYVTTAHGARRADDPGVPIDVRDGEPVTGVTIELIGAAAIAGTVRDHVGLPHADALVTVYTYRSQARGRVLVAASQPMLTDVHGRYRVHGPPCDWICRCTGPEAPKRCCGRPSRGQIQRRWRTRLTSAVKRVALLATSKAFR